MTLSLVLTGLFFLAFIIGFQARLLDSSEIEGIAIGIVVASSVVASAILIESAMKRFLADRHLKRMMNAPIGESEAKEMEHD